MWDFGSFLFLYIDLVSKQKEIGETKFLVVRVRITKLFKFPSTPPQWVLPTIFHFFFRQNPIGIWMKIWIFLIKKYHQKRVFGRVSDNKKMSCAHLYLDLMYKKMSQTIVTKKFLQSLSVLTKVNKQKEIPAVSVEVCPS